MPPAIFLAQFPLIRSLVVLALLFALGKSEFAQKVLTGCPEPPGYDSLFNAQSQGKTSDASGSKGTTDTK